MEICKLFTELPRTCFGESLKWGVRRIAELCVFCSIAISLGAFILLVSVHKYLAYGAILGFLAVMAVSLVGLACSVALFAGTVNNKPYYLRPWLWFFGSKCILLILLLLGCIIGSGFYAPLGVASALSPAVIAYCAFIKYFCQVVYALTLELEGGFTRPQSLLL